jgi:glycosyltransferase involved in cell wall biosynthesis
VTLTVLNVAYPLAPVGPDAVGGAEQVLSRLDAALVRAGHRSLVVACEGSVAEGTLLAVPRHRGALTDEVRRAAQELHRAAIERALARWPVDLVHLHGVDFHAYLPPPGVPALATLHLPPGWYPPSVFQLERPRTWLHCVSSAQRRSCPPDARLLPDAIENGVPVEALSARCKRRGFALALGRICPEKGFHVALAAAKRAGVALLLGGEVFAYAEHALYFAQEIAPRLDRRRRFLGPLGFGRKRLLLSGARCLLVPSLVPETSSLVAMEALACGAPVVASRSGALVELVEHGRTGFLVGGELEMAEAIGAAETLDPAACREAARARFSEDRMTGRYLALYRSIAAGAAPDGPRAPESHRGGGPSARPGERPG